MGTRDGDEVRTTIRQQYGRIAEEGGEGCAPGCCGPSSGAGVRLGYPREHV